MIYPPPLYLTEFVEEIDDQIFSQIQESYGNYTTAFKFRTLFKSVIQTWVVEFGAPGGTIWGIDRIGNQIAIFDQSKYGYNGQMGLNEPEDLNSTGKIDLDTETEIIIAFQYGGDEEDYVKDGASKFKQDYFDWVIVYKFSNNKLEEIFGYECA